jgi:hypothetical protein
MNGFIRKAAVLSFIFFSIASFATDLSKSEIYSTKMGCMACHQGGSMQTYQMLVDKEAKKSQHHQYKKHHGKYAT